MNSSSRNFEALRRLLALKRHEVPPPGYFHGFSSQIMSRIEAGERGEPESFIGRWLEGATWLRRLRNVLEAQPAFAGACGAIACGLLITGILYSESGGVPVAGITPAMAGDAMPTFDNPAPLAMNNPTEPVQLVSSTNPVAPTTASLFDQIQLPAVRAGYTLPAGN
jgi:hypothetical protein